MDTPAHFAARLGCCQAFSTLSQLQANLSVRNKWDLTPSEELAQFSTSCRTATTGTSTLQTGRERSHSSASIAKNARSRESHRALSVGARPKGHWLARNSTSPIAHHQDTSNGQQQIGGTVGIVAESSYTPTPTPTPLSSYSATHITTQQQKSGKVGGASKSVTDVIPTTTTSAASTPNSEHRQLGRKGKYSMTRVQELRGRDSRSSQSEKLQRKKREHGTGAKTEPYNTPELGGKGQVEKKRESLV